MIIKFDQNVCQYTKKYQTIKFLLIFDLFKIKYRKILMSGIIIVAKLEIF